MVGRDWIHVLCHIVRCVRDTHKYSRMSTIWHLHVATCNLFTVQKSTLPHIIFWVGTLNAANNTNTEYSLIGLIGAVSRHCFIYYNTFSVQRCTLNRTPDDDVYRELIRWDRLGYEEEIKSYDAVVWHSLSVYKL